MKDFEMEDAVPSQTLIPIPPTETKPSKLPMPSRNRSKSANSANASIIFG